MKDNKAALRTELKELEERIMFINELKEICAKYERMYSAGSIRYDVRGRLASLEAEREACLKKRTKIMNRM